MEFFECEFDNCTQKYKGFFEFLAIKVTFWMRADVFSPDSSEKPFAGLLYFFLAKNERPKEALF